MRLFFSPEFGAGLAAGVVGLTLAFMVGMLWKSRRLRPAQGSGLVLVLAVMLATSTVARPATSTIWVGVAALAIGGFITNWIHRWQPLVSLVLAAPGAWIISEEAVISEAMWTKAFLFGFLLTAAPAFGHFLERGERSRWSSVLVAATSAGIFLSVPDTEHALILLGAATPLALLSLPTSPVRYGSAGAFAVVGLLAWVVTRGGIGRPPSVIGALACLGIILADPLAKGLSRGHQTLLDRTQSAWSGLILATLLHSVVVILVARSAGTSSSVAFAGASAGAVVFGTMVILRVGAPRVAPPRHRRG